MLDIRARRLSRDLALNTRTHGAKHCVKLLRLRELMLLPFKSPGRGLHVCLQKKQTSFVYLVGFSSSQYCLACMYSTGAVFFQTPTSFVFLFILYLGGIPLNFVSWKQYSWDFIKKACETFDACEHLEGEEASVLVRAITRVIKLFTRFSTELSVCRCSSGVNCLLLHRLLFL